MTDAEATNLINSNLLPANMQTPAAGNTISNADLSDQLFKDAFGSSSATTNSTTTPAQGSTSGNLDTGYRAEAFPVAAPVNTTSKLLDSLPPIAQDVPFNIPVDEYGTPFNISADENDKPFSIPADENGVPLPPSAMDKIRNIKEAQDYFNLIQTLSHLPLSYGNNTTQINHLQQLKMALK